MYIMLWSHAAAADIETADTFRREMYNLVGIPLPDLPAKKVLFWLRRYVIVYVCTPKLVEQFMHGVIPYSVIWCSPPLGRSMLNVEVLLEVCDRYNITYT